mgnify:CR=1 FL=1
MTKEEFFTAVAAYLGEPEYNETIGYGRWRRGAGGGRFIGHGVIRYYNDSNILVLLVTPHLAGKFSSPEDALNAIKSVSIQ